MWVALSSTFCAIVRLALLLLPIPHSQNASDVCIPLKISAMIEGFAAQRACF